MKTYFECVQYIKNELVNHYPEGEITGFISIIFYHLENLSLSQLNLKYKDSIKTETIQNIEYIVSELKENKPIQYIIGETEFFSLKFRVNANVLIPRPETEELVDWIVKDFIHFKNLRVLDIGSGSGCIAISLSKNLDCHNVNGFEISSGAIRASKINAKLNGVKVKFFKKNILKIFQKIYKKKYDIIVSNPPYVTQKEKELMHKNVLNYEPHTALFVEDDNPLVFYKTIAEFAKNNLKAYGCLYFEINEKFGTQIFNLLLGEKFNTVILRKDINGKDRMIKAILKADE